MNLNTPSSPVSNTAPRNSAQIAGMIVVFVVLGSIYLFRSSMPKGDQQAQPSPTVTTPAMTEHAGHMMSEMSVKNDQEFLEQMVPHHQEAVDSSKFMLTQTKDAEFKTFLQNIVTTQTSEVTSMKNWYQTWYGKAFPSSTKYMSMMRPLDAFDGDAAIKKAFLEDMIAHHQAAVKMAEQILPITKREEIKKLANDIIKTQNTEITTMQQWLR